MCSTQGACVVMLRCKMNEKAWLMKEEVFLCDVQGWECFGFYFLFTCWRRCDEALRLWKQNTVVCHHTVSFSWRASSLLPPSILHRSLCLRLMETCRSDRELSVLVITADYTAVSRLQRPQQTFTQTNYKYTQTHKVLQSQSQRLTAGQQVVLSHRRLLWPWPPFTYPAWMLKQVPQNILSRELTEECWEAQSVCDWECVPQGPQVLHVF